MENLCDLCKFGLVDIKGSSEARNVSLAAFTLSIAVLQQILKVLQLNFHHQAARRQVKMIEVHFEHGTVVVSASAVAELIGDVRVSQMPESREERLKY